MASIPSAFQRIVAPAFISLLAVSTAILCAALGIKYILAMCLAGMAALLFVTLRSSYKVFLLSFLLLFLIPVNLDINFYVVKHVGGAASISISGAWCVASILFLILARKNIYASHRIEAGAEFVSIIVYIAFGILSFVNSAYPLLSVFEVVRLLMLLVVTLAVLNISDRNVIQKMAFFLALAVLAQSLLAFVQFFVKSFPSMDIIGIKTVKELFPGQKVHRAMGTLGHPNFLGYYLELNLPIILGLFLTSWTRTTKIIAGLALVLGTVALILSKSRGAWVAYPFAMMGTVFLTYGRSFFSKHVFVKAVGLFLLASLLVLFFLPSIVERLVGKDYQALSIRMPLNKAAISIIAQHPFIGVGLNNFSEVFKSYDTTGHSLIFRGFKHVVHNMYLLVATETGIVGLLAFLGIFAVPFLRLFRSLVHCEDLFLRSMIVGGTMGLWAHLIHGFADPGFIVSPTASQSIFFIIGFVGASYRICRKQRAQ